MLAGPENMEGRSACREFENNDSLPIQISRCDTPFGQFKVEKFVYSNVSILVNIRAI